MTDTLTAGDLDLEQLEKSHADDSVTCDFEIIPNLECGRDARWRYQHECGAIWLDCDEHRRLDDLELAWQVPFMRHACTRCDKTLPRTIPWLPI